MSSLMKKARHTLVGDRVFYRTLLAIVVPVIIQNGISNFVNLLDNLMVGALGDAQMSGVSIATNWFLFSI
jgi:Na+-driven multidrug efflux pump